MTYNFHSSGNHMHLSFKSICNKEHKGVICNMPSLSNSSQSTRPTGRVLGKNYSSFLDFTRNYERTSGIFVPWFYDMHFLPYSDHTRFRHNEIITEKERKSYFGVPLRSDTLWSQVYRSHPLWAINLVSASNLSHNAFCAFSHPKNIPKPDIA